MYAYSLSFSGQQYNYAATVAIIMGVITMVIAYVVQLRGTREKLMTTAAVQSSGRTGDSRARRRQALPPRPAAQHRCSRCSPRWSRSTA